MDPLTERLHRALAGQFSIDRELPGGGMARVFLARDAALGRAIVVKVLDLEEVAGGSAERFRREMRLLAQLQHPHIVQLITAGDGERLLWYAMPYVAGESARARLTREGALPVADAARLVREVLDALAYAHERGVMHRDVKPENILLSGGHAVLADFGVAKALADAGVSGTGGLTTKGMAVGTPAYMAPEQAMAETTTNHRADLYAVGIVLYEFLVGAPPFTGTAEAVIAAHITAAIPRVEERRTDIPPPLAALVARLLAKSPAQRPQSAAEALAALSAVEGSERSGPRRTPLMTAHWRVASLLFLGAVLAAAGGWWWSRPAPAPVGRDNLLAVLPPYAPSDSSLVGPATDLAMLMSLKLDGVGALVTVDRTSLLNAAEAYRRALTTDDARDIARRFGAGRVVQGTVLSDGPTIRADLGMYDVGTGHRLAQVTASAPRGDLQALADSLSRKLVLVVLHSDPGQVPGLAEVADGPLDALRAMATADQLVRRGQGDSAVAEYQRAIHLDTALALAYFYLDLVQTNLTFTPDTAVRSRLRALKERLPKRDRDLLEARGTGLLEARGSGQPILQKLASLQAVAAAYPEYPAAQYEAAELIIHSGPLFGVPMSAAVPYVQRLQVVAPRYFDHDVHRKWVTFAVGDTNAAFAAAESSAVLSAGSPFGEVANLEVAAIRAHQSGRDLSTEEVVSHLRRIAPTLRRFAYIPWVAPDVFTPPLNPPAIAESALAIVSHDPAFAGFGAMVTSARGHLAIARGEVSQGLDLLQDLTADTTAPMSIRLAAARYAVIGAWLGEIPGVVAESVLARTRRLAVPQATQPRAELRWLEGVAGLVADDSNRVFRAVAASRDTAREQRYVGRSLRALWRERYVHTTDSLKALEDEAMADGFVFGPTLPMHRWLIARALIREGHPREAERYLMWPDAVSGLKHVGPNRFAYQWRNAYERGKAAEAAGDSVSARRYLHTFLLGTDRPAGDLRRLVNDANRRLAGLAGR